MQLDKQYKVLDTLHDYLVVKGVPIPEAYKRRDPREPGRTEKERLEDKLMAAFGVYFGEQAKEIRKQIRKAIDAGETDPDKIMASIELPQPKKKISGLFLQALLLGLALFIADQEGGPEIDWTETNNDLVGYSIEYVQEMLGYIDETTYKAARKAIERFTDLAHEEGGITIKDVMDLLPFTEDRAQMIAIDFVTDAAASAQQKAGEDLKARFPDAEVTKTWHTNRDERVCFICGPLDGDTVLIDRAFFNREAKLAIFKPKAHNRGRCWISVSVR